VLSDHSRARALDILERSGWTAAQQFVAVLLAGAGVGTVVGLPWRLAASAAVGAAFVSVLGTLLQYVVTKKTKNFWQDVLVRMGKTFIASLSGSIAAEKLFSAFDFDWPTALNIAALATLGVLGKATLAGCNGSGDNPPAPSLLQRNPSTLPTAQYLLATR
jgi:uncharacterized membrane protein YjjP (DUF1212 family)